MSGYKGPDFRQRQEDAAAAKRALLERAKAVSEDPSVADRKAARAETQNDASVR